MPPGDERYSLDATSEMALPPVEADGFHPGAVLGQYRLLERIGMGGMGEVFKAVHPTMLRTVAVKIMAPALVQDPRARARFRREVQSAARLAHPNIVMAYDAAEEGGRCFLVMEYVEGRDAAALLAAFGPPPVHLACEVIRQAALGLQHAHEQGMIHRDIKPGNLVIAARRAPNRDAPAPPGWPAEPLVKVLDFGLARLQAGDSEAPIRTPGSTPLTREGHVVGTPEYMAPEQACDGGRTDIRSDIYSLGCTFYCLLAGRPPFTGPSLLEIMVQHLQSTPPPVSQVRPDVPPEVVAILERMLAKRPEQRYQEPAEVARALAPWATAPAHPPSLAVVPAGAPLNLYPATQGSGTPQVPTAPNPVPAAATAPASTPGVVTRAVTATARAFFGCFLLFLVMVAAMIAGFVYLTRGDHGDPAAADGPPPLDGLELVPLRATRFVPSYATSAVEVPYDFIISAREVTRKQFRAFAEAKHYLTSAERGTAGRGHGALVLTGVGGGTWDEGATWNTWRRDLPDDTPVVCVSWEDAVNFCNWLSERGHLRGCYTLRGGPGGGWDCDLRAPGYRLPTEAEWEYAAGSGGPALYPERDLLEYGWFRDNAGGGPHPVGGRRLNAHQLCDVWGNVWEWCWDRSANDERVARGGGWSDPAPVSPAQTRKSLAPDYRANDVGFRVVRTMAGP